MEDYVRRHAMATLKTAELQARLDEVGCRNIQFSINREGVLQDESIPLEQRLLMLRESMNKMVEAYFKGEFEPLEFFDETPEYVTESLQGS